MNPNFFVYCTNLEISELVKKVEIISIMELPQTPRPINFRTYTFFYLFLMVSLSNQENGWLTD